MKCLKLEENLLLYKIRNIMYVCLPCDFLPFSFFFFFRETQQDPVLLNVEDYNSLRESTFDKDHPTKIIIHGFGGGRNLVPSTDLRDGRFHLNYTPLYVCT